MRFFGYIMALSLLAWPLVGDSRTQLSDEGAVLHREDRLSLPVGKSGSWHWVEWIEFTVRPSVEGSKLEVLADGESRCVFDLPNEISILRCPILRTAQTVSFRSLSDGVRVRGIVSHQSAKPPIKFELKETPSFRDLPRRESTGAEGSPLEDLELPQSDRATYLARRTQQIVSHLIKALSETFFNKDIDVTILKRDVDSIKVLAGFALAKAKPNRDFSFNTVFAMLRLQKQIDGCGETIKTLLANGDTYYLALDLLTVREVIEDRLDTHQLERELGKKLLPEASE
ncbi:MAG: hypothetical protein HYR96_01050 [Deltaproteobacteria bacterium]|nr:hypothetical protein [Deltaproteobacteria bacterium]MBI3293431.1 hypothetical protein [Deltaproteobacteria bacterium]